MFFETRGPRGRGTTVARRSDDGALMKQTGLGTVRCLRIYGL